MGVFHRSMAGTALILAVFVLRVFALRRLPKVTFWALWMVAAARLLFPFSIPSRFSLYNFAGNIAREGGVLAGSLRVEGVAQAAGNGALPYGAVAGIGCGVLAVCFLVSYVSCWKKFCTALPVWQDGVEGWVREKNRKGLSVRVSDQIRSPLTYGVFRPVILLPKGMDWEDKETLQYILDHEYVHIRHCDALAKVIFAVVLCMHWFNPAVWGMYFLANRDMELYCDETVVRMGDDGAREKYALCLLRMEEWKKRPLSLYSNFSGNALKERIVAIMKTKKKSALNAVLAAGIVAGMAVLFGTVAFAKGAQKEDGQGGGTGTFMLCATPTPAPGEEGIPVREYEVAGGWDADGANQGMVDLNLINEKIRNGEASMVFVDENGEPDESGNRDYVKVVDQDGNVLLAGQYTDMADGAGAAEELPVWDGADRNAVEEYIIKFRK